MNSLSSLARGPAARALRWAALATAAALALSACGPGTGGTGDGVSASALDAFGASPANVCTSGPSSALACPPAGNTGTGGAAGLPTPSPGTDGVLFADTASGNDVVLSLSGSHAVLTARCLDLSFEGDWGLVAGDNPRYFGRHSVGNGGKDTLSALTVQASGGDNKGLTATLRDRQGVVVLGPVPLRRVVIPAPGSQDCPR